MFDDNRGFMQTRFLMPRFTGAVRTIIIICVAVFVLQSLTQRSMSIDNLFALVPDAVIHHFAIWQIFTHMWLHGGVGHLLINMFVLWMVGYPVEARMGRRSFWWFYIVCGLAGGASALGFSLLRGEGAAHILGASGAIYGILVAFAMMYPDAIFLFMFFIPMRARTMMFILVGVQILTALREGSVGSLGHLGGMLAGFLILKGEDPLRYLKTWLRSRWRRRGAWERRPSVRFDEADDEELDRVLDKIHREGIGSLDAREKEVLRRASDRNRR